MKEQGIQSGNIPEDIKQIANKEYGHLVGLHRSIRVNAFIAGYSLGAELLAQKEEEINEYSRNLKNASDRCSKLTNDVYQQSKEIAELKAWKESAMSVMAPIQEIGKALNIRLGESIHDKILPEIERLQKTEKEFLKNFDFAKEILRLKVLINKLCESCMPEVDCIKFAKANNL